MLRTVQELEDKNELSRHYTVKVDGETVLRDNKNILEVLQNFEAIEEYLVIQPDEWAKHTMVEID